MHDDFVYFDTAHCVIKSNVKDFLDYRQFPKNNPVENIKVEWDEDWSYEHDFGGVTTPYFIKSFGSFEEATSFLYRLMAGFTSSMDLKEDECELYEDMTDFEETFRFVKVARVVLEVEFEKADEEVA